MIDHMENLMIGGKHGKRNMLAEEHIDKVATLHIVREVVDKGAPTFSLMPKGERIPNQRRRKQAKFQNYHLRRNRLQAGIIVDAINAKVGVF